MINYLKDLINHFKTGSLRYKIVSILVILLYVSLLVAGFVKIDVVVTTPGLINNTAQTSNEDKGYVPLTIDTNNTSGNIFTIGVYSHYQVSLFQFLISKLSSDVDISVYDQSSDLSEAEEYVRGVIHKEISIKNAIIVAYEAAKLKDPAIVLEKLFLGIRVSAVTQLSKSNLLMGDLIVKFNDTEITDFQHFLSLRDAQTNTETFNLTVIRDDEEIVIQSQMYEQMENSNTIYRLGIEALPDYKIENAFPKYELSDELDSIGGSGGAMLTLSIYNSLLTEDITMGKTIVGTGTMAIDGTIGDIGAVTQKIVTAQLYDVDYFFVNPEDYEEASQKHQSINAQFDLIKVNNFQELVLFLEGENNG